MDILEWARKAEIGHRVVYNVGQRPGAAGPSAMEAHEAGLVFLSQRRIIRDYTVQYEYIATRVSTPCALALRLVERSAR